MLRILRCLETLGALALCIGVSVAEPPVYESLSPGETPKWLQELNSLDSSERAKRVKNYSEPKRSTTPANTMQMPPKARRPVAPSARAKPVSSLPHSAVSQKRQAHWDINRRREADRQLQEKRGFELDARRKQETRAGVIAARKRKAAQERAADKAREEQLQRQRQRELEQQEARREARRWAMLEAERERIRSARKEKEQKAVEARRLREERERVGKLEERRRVERARKERLARAREQEEAERRRREERKRMRDEKDSRNREDENAAFERAYQAEIERQRREIQRERSKKKRGEIVPENNNRKRGSFFSRVFGGGSRHRSGRNSRIDSSLFPNSP